MKRLILISNSIIILLSIGCSTTDVKISEPSNEESQKIKSIGDSLSKKLIAALKGELSKAIQEKGVINAIQVCNLKALPITKQIGTSEEYSIDIKRTTSKYRNPQNKPNVVEELALEQYRKLYKENQPLPEYFIQKISEDNNDYYNYYKPLKTASLCLLCHGDPQTMDESLKDILKRLYPNDLATGHNEGDFRALLRIKIMDKN
jgi:hypothetical protein